MDNWFIIFGAGAVFYGFCSVLIKYFHEKFKTNYHGNAYRISLINGKLTKTDDYIKRDF